MKITIKNSLKVLLVALMLMVLPGVRHSVDAEDSSVFFPLEVYDGKKPHEFTRDPIKITSTLAYEKGIRIGGEGGDSATITSKNGEIITKIVLIEYVAPITNLVVSSGDITFGASIATVTNINATSVTLTNSSSAIGDWFTINEATIYYTSPVDVTGVTLNKQTTTLFKGSSETLTATVAPTDATNKTVTWTTSDSNVATVENGVVTAAAPGTATITATATNGTETTDDDKTATCAVTVVPLTIAIGVTAGGSVKVSGDPEPISGKGARNYSTEEDSFTLTATPSEGYNFDGWYVGKLVNGFVDGNTGTLESKNTEITINKDSTNKTLEAVFRKMPIVTYDINGGTPGKEWADKIPEIYGEELDYSLIEGGFQEEEIVTPPDGKLYIGFTIIDGENNTFVPLGSTGKLVITNDITIKIEWDTDRYYPNAGDNGSWQKGSTSPLSFTFKRTIGDSDTFGSFQGIKIDDKEVADTNYDKTAGSVIIDLKPSYLETLSVGNHTITAVFTDEMTATAKFSITEKKEEEKKDSSSSSTTAYKAPKTGIE